MLLAIDTATRWLGVALHDGKTLVGELGWQSEHAQTVELAATVEELLTRVAVSPADLSAVAVALGPGSYTGLRVGLGFAKGMAVANQLPLIGISTLDSVAFGVGRLPGQLVAVAEAGRTRICAGSYKFHRTAGWQPLNSPQILSWEELLEELSGKVTFVGEVSAEGRKLIRKQAKGWRVLPASNSTRRAGNLAQLAMNRFKKNKLDDPAALTPIYLREPAGS